MFSSKSTTHRKSSSQGSEGKDAATSKRIRVTSENLQTSFESLIATLQRYEEDVLDRDSVVEMVKSIYNWMVFDPSLQLRLPSPPGSSVVKRMWPQGSAVDARKKPDNEKIGKSSRRLKDLDDDTASIVASSVVSSALEEERSVKPRGEVVVEPPGGWTYNSSGYSNFPPGYRPAPPRPLASQHSGPPPMSYAAPPGSMRMVPEGFAPHSGDPRAVPRYSVVGPPVRPPERVEETPELHHADVYPKKKTRKPRVGAARREMGEDEGGTPVVLEDY